jgi:hypothetical protein
MGRDGTHPGPAERLPKKKKKGGQNCGSSAIAMNNSTGAVDISNMLNQTRFQITIIYLCFSNFLDDSALNCIIFLTVKIFRERG